MDIPTPIDYHKLTTLSFASPVPVIQDDDVGETDDQPTTLFQIGTMDGSPTP